MNYSSKYLIIILLALLIAPFTWGQTFVKDAGEYLSPEEEAILEKKLKEYSDATSNQIAIRTIQTLGGENLEDYSLKLANELGVGQKDKDNGILILISKQERKIRIEVGSGLHEVITNFQAKEIITKFIAPELKAGKNFQALRMATDKIISLMPKIPPNLQEKYPEIDSPKHFEKDLPEAHSLNSKEIRYLENIDDELKSMDFVVDYEEFITSKQASTLNGKLQDYAENNDSQIWIRTIAEDFRDEKLLFKYLMLENPGKKNYAIIYVQTSTFYNGEMSAELFLGKPGGVVIDKYDTTPELEEVLNAFDSVLHHYFELNMNFRYWPYAGLNRIVYLLQKHYAGSLEVEDIEPHWWYSDHPLYIMSFYMGTLIFVILLLVFTLSKLFGGGGGSFWNGSGNSGRSSGSRGDQQSWYDSGSSSSGGSSGGGSSFGGGSFGGDGGSDDY